MNPLLFVIYNGNKAAVSRLINNGADLYTDSPWFEAKKRGFDDIAALLPISFDQDFLILLLKKFGYQVNHRGVCLGFSHMVKHAIHSRQIDSLNTKLINLINLVLEKNFNVLQDLSADYDLQALLDGIYLYQYHPNHSGIYPHFNFNYNTAAAQDTLKLLMPEDAIEYRGQFSSVYDVSELQTYLDLILKHLKNNQVHTPLSMVLHNHHHVITIGFDPLEDTWFFADAKNLPIKKIQDTAVLAKNIFESLSSAINTILFANATDRKNIDNFLTSLHQDATWQELHKVTAKKIKHGHWEKIAYGDELKNIQKFNLKNNYLYRLFKLPVKCFNTYNSFLTNKTRGKYYQEKDALIYQDYFCKLGPV